MRVYVETKEVATKIIRQIGRRGAFLTFLALLDLSYGYSLLASPALIKAFNLLLPYQAWAGAWLTSGVICATGIFSSRDRIQFSAAAFLKASWAFVMVRVWLYQHSPLGWVSVAIWLAFAAIIVLVSGWHENSEIRLRKPAPPTPITGVK
jgi:hypothetical protein